MDDYAGNTKLSEKAINLFVFSLAQNPVCYKRWAKVFQGFQTRFEELEVWEQQNGKALNGGMDVKRQAIFSKADQHCEEVLRIVASALRWHRRMTKKSPLYRLPEPMWTHKPLTMVPGRLVVIVVVLPMFPLFTLEASLTLGIHHPRYSFIFDTDAKCFLKDADKRQLNDSTVRNYVREIRRLAYRTEDVLEKFAVEIESRRRGHSFRKAFRRFSCLISEGISLHRVGSEIASIKAGINSLTTDLENYGVIALSSTEDGQSSNARLDQNQQRLRQTYPHQVEEYFVGMKDDIRQLVSLITDEGIRSHRVISVHGMGGLGKTTLARKIYKHIEVERAFKQFAWVSVTQQCNTMTVFRDILKQLVPDQRKDSVGKMDERELVGELYKVQIETKSFVVLDDLWKIEDWECLKVAFPFAEADSKILITTRNQKLVEDEFLYPLNLLNEDEGWELLQKRAFTRRNGADCESDPLLEAVGRAIVRECGNLPLAISAIGGVLSQKTSLEEWETVKNDVDSYIRMSEGGKEGYGAVLQVLALSYDELPYHLKPCFLYLGQFREDEDIDAEMLYRMWTAEGMVSSDHRGKGETLTDIAERYLYEMAGRSMLQLKFSASRKVESCYLHDLMRDFCLARGKEVEFLKLLDFRGGNDPLSDCSTERDDSTPRCSIHVEDGPGEVESMISMALEASGQLRSLTLSGGSGYPKVSISFPQVICDSNKFKYLKVLKFEGYDFTGKGLPKGIKKLVNLRFLSVKDSIMLELPSSIGQLQYLETLDIRVSVTMRVPDVLCKLKGLKHLYFSLTKEGDGQLSFLGLSKLETLVGFDDDVGDLKHLSGLNNLRFLGATVNIRKEKNDLPQMLNYLNSNRHNLREARLVIYVFDEEVVLPFLDLLSCHCLHQLSIIGGRYEFQKVKPPLSPSNLSELSLRRCSIEGDPMSFLGNLPNLRSLRLALVELVETKTMVIDGNAFPKLVSLRIIRIKNLEKWVVAEGSMPNLSHLAIEFCEALEMIPDGLRFITTLRKLEIEMPEEFIVRRINGIDGRGGPDCDKIRHVPVIKIESYGSILKNLQLPFSLLN
ncbi:probable disease resistance protein At1g58390 [Coffea eugenioides]|uniref:probable disease resistance protein At1g58390 n=1 Tax=Coffea eugenioides TaxID=49369 RepID=UPI000F608F7A|nr:probable disease resistance protein At1g58390 [Coffea eugenioides]